MGGAFAALGRRFELLEGSVTASSFPIRSGSAPSSSARRTRVPSPFDWQAQIVAGGWSERASHVFRRRSSEARQSTVDLKEGEAVSLSDSERRSLCTCSASGPLESSFGQARRPAAPRSRIGRSSRYAGARVGTREGSQRLPDQIAKSPGSPNSSKRRGSVRKSICFSAKNLAAGTLLARRHRKSTGSWASRATVGHRIGSRGLGAGTGGAGYADAGKRHGRRARGTSLRVRTATARDGGRPITSFLRRRRVGRRRARHVVGSGSRATSAVRSGGLRTPLAEGRRSRGTRYGAVARRCGRHCRQHPDATGRASIPTA